jgi:hypothetical protein
MAQSKPTALDEIISNANSLTDVFSGVLNTLGVKGGIGQLDTSSQDMRDTKALQLYKKLYGSFLSPELDDPKKLMKYIDDATRHEHTRSPGQKYDGFRIEKAQEALGAIYGITDYTPRGFQEKTPPSD